LLSSRSYSRMGRERRVFALSRGQVAQEVVREDGVPLDEMDAAVFHEGRWHIALTEGDGTKLFIVDAGIARLVRTLARAGTPPAPLTLVRNVVDGGVQLALDNWVFANDLREAPVQIGSSTALRLCQNDTEAYPYRSEQALPYNVEVRDGKGASKGVVHTIAARLRHAPGKEACVERLSGLFDTELGTWSTSAPIVPSGRKYSVTLIGVADDRRHVLKCTLP
jgi:hypothetical protein